jgi:hypothetical protein
MRSLWKGVKEAVYERFEKFGDFMDDIVDGRSVG